jgi:NADPH:quinone reductase-like Zn-dependent oxidoreductase
MYAMFPPAVAEAMHKLFDLLARGELHPTVARIFPLEDAAAAQRHLIEDRPYGRVLLRVA